MRESLGQFPALLLRKLFFSLGSLLRLCLSEETDPARDSDRPPLQHVALRRVSAPAGRLRAAVRRRPHAALGSRPWAAAPPEISRMPWLRKPPSKVCRRASLSPPTSNPPRS